MGRYLGYNPSGLNKNELNAHVTAWLGVTDVGDVESFSNAAPTDIDEYLGFSVTELFGEDNAPLNFTVVHPSIEVAPS